jgi:curved DNA-binding protein CbpA
MNFYEILRIPIEADADMIRTAFRKLARQYHPDAGDGSSSERFREAAEAYETLTDPVRRQAYNKTLSRRSGTPIPVRVERYAPHVEPMRPTSAPVDFLGASRSTIEFSLLIEGLLDSLVDDFFFDW